jgi:methionine biosynthesis protein MetW
MKAVCRFAIESNPKTVLDIGCGDGTIAKIIKELTDAEVYGVDVSDDQVQISLKKGIIAQKIDVCRENLPFKQQFFDVVLLSRVIEHLINPDFTISEINRVLKRGGILILSTPNLASWYNRLLLLVGIQPVFTEVSTRMILGRKFRFLGQYSTPVGHIRVFTLNALKDLLRLYGFKVRQVHGTIFLERRGIFTIIDKLFSNIPSLSSYVVVKAVKS